MSTKVRRKVKCSECQELRQVLKEGVEELQRESDAFDEYFKAEMLKDVIRPKGSIGEMLIRMVNNHNRAKWFANMLE
jgi:hypothetical protein